MFSPIKALATGAVVFALGGVLLLAQPMPGQDADTPGAASASEDPAASSEPTARDFIEWGSKRIYYTPPPRWLPFLEGTEDRSLDSPEFHVHDVDRVVTDCSAEGAIFAAVGPTTEELTDAIVNRRGCMARLPPMSR